jgi:hypothetical protein
MVYGSELTGMAEGEGVHSPPNVDPCNRTMIAMRVVGDRKPSPKSLPPGRVRLSAQSALSSGGGLQWEACYRTYQE